MSRSAKQNSFKWAKSIIVSIAAVMVALTIIYANVDKAVGCFQRSVVTPIVKEQFNLLHHPFEKTLDTVGYNTKVIVEMIKILNENDPALLNKAIDRVDNAGKW